MLSPVRTRSNQLLRDGYPVSPVSRRACALFGIAASLIIAFAGVAKLIDAPQFVVTLRASPALPRGAEGLLAIAIPGIELLLGLSVVVGLARFRCALALLAMMVVFSVVLVVAPPPPGGCGCFGRVTESLPWFESGAALHARNGLIIAGLLCGILAWRGDHSAVRPAASPVSPASTAPQRAATTGFTLIEVLVVVAIVGILILLATPALKRARTDTREQVSLSNLRSHGQIVASYLNDSNGVFPHFTKPGEEVTLSARGGAVQVQARYFDAARTWHVALADGYYAGDTASASFLSPEARAALGPGHASVRPTSYWYSCSFLADPEFYEWGKRRDGFEQLRGVRAAQVQFPGQKSVFGEYRVAVDDSVSPPVHAPIDPGNFSFVDGHAEAVPAARWLEQFGDGDFRLELSEHISPYFEPLGHAVGGARGRDVK